MREFPADIAAILNPSLRALYNKFASKLTNLSDFQISRLSDEEIFNLVEEKFSNLSETESNLIIHTIMDPLIYSLFPRKISIPKDEGMSDYMTLLEQDVVSDQSSPNWGNLFFWGAVGLASLVIMRRLLSLGCDYVLNKGYGCVANAIDHTTKEQLKLSKRSPSLLPKSKYARSAIVPKGLKGVGEPYIQETNMVLRQEVEQQQEGASRAVVPSSRSIGKEKQIR